MAELPVVTQELKDRILAAYEVIEVEGKSDREILTALAAELSRDAPLTSSDFDELAQVVEVVSENIRQQKERQLQLSERVVRAARVVLRASPGAMITSDLCEAIEAMIRTGHPANHIAAELHALAREGHLVRESRTSRRTGNRYHLWSLPAENEANDA